MGGAPRVLVEQRHALVDAIGLAGPVELRVCAGEGVGHDVQRLRRADGGLGAAVEADLARGRAEAVGPPVRPVAAERLELGAVLLFEPLEERAVRGRDELRVGVLARPGGGDLRRHGTRSGVVGEQALNAEVQQVERVRRPGARAGRPSVSCAPA